MRDCEELNLGRARTGGWGRFLPPTRTPHTAHTPLYPATQTRRTTAQHDGAWRLRRPSPLEAACRETRRAAAPRTCTIISTERVGRLHAWSQICECAGGAVVKMPSLAARAVPPAIWEALHFSEQLQLSPEESNHSSLSYGLVALIPELHELERSVHNVQWTVSTQPRASYS